MESLLPRGTHVEIGTIEGGIFRNIVSENVRVYSENDSSGVNIERIEIKYRVWYPLLKKIRLFPDIAERQKIVLFIGEEGHDLVSGFLELDGSNKKLDAQGYLAFKNKEKIFIKGVLEQEKPSVFHITFKKGSANISVEKKNKQYIVNGRFDHIPLGNKDLIGECRAVIEYKDDNFLRIKASLKNILIDYVPFDKEMEISLGYDRSKAMLNIERFKVAQDIEGEGYLMLEDPRFIFLKWIVKDLELEDYFISQSPKDIISGTMNGAFTLKGPLKSPKLSAHLDVQNGRTGDMPYDSIIANLRGEGPVITIYDSRIRKEGGYIILGGEIDLSKLKGNKAFDKLLLDPSDNFFVWEGWSVKKDYSDSSVMAEKYLDEDVNLSFKAYTDYKNPEEEKHFLGVEHKVKF